MAPDTPSGSLRNFLYGFASAQTRVRYAPGEPALIGDAQLGIPASSIAAVAFGGDGGGRPY